MLRHLAPPLLVPLLAALVAVLLAVPTARACTTLVANAAATVDGRPLLWKNRDFTVRNNEVVHVAEPGEIGFVALVNAGSTRSAWAGVNEAGFGIVNTLTRDIGEAGERGPANGRLMRDALAECRTVADFEAMLRRTNETGRRTRSTFSVLDATGEVAVFEVAPERFVRYDPDQPSAAAPGLLVRSNFTFTAAGRAPGDPVGDLDVAYALERYERAVALCAAPAVEGELSLEHVLHRVARDHSDREGQPWPGSINDPDAPPPEAIDTARTISRRTTVSAVVIQGVRPGEDPRLTTMWVMMGEPALSVAVPCWPAAEGVSRLLDGEETSPLCDLAVQLRDQNYEAGKLNPARLAEIRTATLAAEEQILSEATAALEAWRKEAPTPEAVRAKHDRLCEIALETMERLVEAGAPQAAE